MANHQRNTDKDKDDEVFIRKIDPNITTFTTQFNRFAPFGFRKFIAVGNRATAIRLSSSKVLLLNPIQLTPSIRETLDEMGGVHYISCDLGHHMYIRSYLDAWPNAKALGVQGLETKRRDVEWDHIYSVGDGNKPPETIFRADWGDDIQTILFDGFITRAIAYLHCPSSTLIVSDLLMNLPCYEQYTPSSSASQGPGSRAFSQAANPYSLFFRSLIYCIAVTDYAAMRRDVKRVAEWDVRRIVVCHGEVIEEGAVEAWRSAYHWFLEGRAKPRFLRGGWDRWMCVMRRVGLGAW